MEAIRSSETSGTTQRTTRRHIPEEDTLQNHRCENLKSYKDNLVHNVWLTASSLSQVATNEREFPCWPSMEQGAHTCDARRGHPTEWRNISTILSVSHLWSSHVTSCMLQSSTPLCIILQWLLALLEMLKPFVHSSHTYGLVTMQYSVQWTNVHTTSHLCPPLPYIVAHAQTWRLIQVICHSAANENLYKRLDFNT
jgi:hypothetical protein